MLGFDPYLAGDMLRGRDHHRVPYLQLHQEALRLYENALRRGHLWHLWEILSGRCQRLLALDSVARPGAYANRLHRGEEVVEIARIQGSEGRSDDFDRAFRPRRSHTRERWVGIAIAHKSGLALPPVTLVQVGTTYFVLDGHHRISVARALGQLYIEARVTTWQPAPAPAAQPLRAPAISRHVPA